MAKKQSQSRRDKATRIVALFVALIHSREVNDMARMAAVRGELRRLGVTVRFANAKGGA